MIATLIGQTSAWVPSLVRLYAIAEDVPWDIEVTTCVCHGKCWQVGKINGLLVFVR